MDCRPSKATTSESGTTTTTEPRGWYSRSVLAAVVAFVSLSACGGDDLLLPKDGEPAHISAVRGNDQRDTVGRPLADSLVVEVTDPSGRPVPNVEVLFVPPAGGTLAPGDHITTGSNGRAAVHYTLSTTSGQQRVEARAPIEPAANAVAMFTLTADAEIPEALIAAGGDGQSAQVSTVLPVPLAVKAVDRFGNGVAGIEVTWQASGGGEVSPATVLTGADGLAATARTLGDHPGSYGTAARANDLDGSPVSFTATAVAAPKPELVLTTQPSSTAAAGVPLDRQPELQLQDPFGAPLLQENVSVTAQIAGSEGSVGGHTTARSDAAGRVRFTDLELRGDPGTRSLIFAADGFTPVTSAEIILRAGPPSPDQSTVSVPNGTAGATTAIGLRLRDEFGNNVSGAAGDISISIAGANPTASLSVTDNGNGSYSASYVPVRTGVDQVSVQFRGTPLGGSPFPSAVSPGPADPSTTTAQVTRSGILFVTVQVFVTTRDAQGNLLGHGGDLIQIIPNGGPPRSCVPPDGNPATCVDNGDGTYADAFVLIASDVSIGVLLNGVPIAGSPFVR